MKLSYYQNSFSVDFVNTSPAVSGKHLYSWKLEGFDKEWSQPSTIPTAVYTNLSSGKYDLLVKTFAKGQNERATTRKLPILIKAPWWLSIWAYLAYMLLLAASVSLASNYYKIRNARRKFSEHLRLSTSISHEIRTPLTLIKGPVSALINSDSLSGEDRGNLDLAKKNIEKLEAIISQFIDYQKTGMSKMQMQVVRADLVVFLDDITASFGPLMKEKNIRFIFTKPDGKIMALFDKDKMEKVINNLLSNAVKYTPANRSIHVTIGSNAKEANFSVTDTGIGIPEQLQRYIFKGYYRADNTST